MAFLESKFTDGSGNSLAESGGIMILRDFTYEVIGIGNPRIDLYLKSQGFISKVSICFFY